MKDAKSVAGFTASANLELDRMTSHRQGLATQYIFKMAATKVEIWAFFETNFFRIAGTSEAETSVSVYLL